MAQVVLNPIKDVHLTSSLATSNQNGIGFIDVGEDNTATSTRRLLIQFDLTAIPNKATITEAVLRLYDTGANLSDNNRTMSCYRCLRVWGETTATWNTYDGSSNWGTAGADNTSSDRESSSIGSILMPASEVVGYVDISLTVSAVQDWLTGSFTNNGLVVRMATETNDLHRFESRGETNKPELVITYTPPTNSGIGYFEV